MVLMPHWNMPAASVSDYRREVVLSRLSRSMYTKIAIGVGHGRPSGIYS